MRIGIALGLLASACTLNYGEGDDTAPPPMTEPPPIDQPPPTEVIAVPHATARDIAVDASYVYWTEVAPDASGTLVRWSKTTHERTELAVFTDGVPNEIALAGGFAYVSELRGWTSNGRDLGHDRLWRVPGAGGSPQIVAEDQWFEDELTDLAGVGDAVYWVHSAFADDGAVRWAHDVAGVAVVETLRTGLDQPRVIGANADDVCFRTGHPNELSPIWCASTDGTALRSVAGGFPRSLAFHGDLLYWADDPSDRLLATSPSGTSGTPDTVMNTGASYMVLDLTSAQRNFFWDAPTETLISRIEMSRPDGTIELVAQPGGSVRSFAVDEDTVWMVDAKANRIIRAARPY